MPQQCNTLGKLEDPQVPQMQKQYLDRIKQKIEIISYIPQKSLSTFKIHSPATCYFFMFEMHSTSPKITTITTLDTPNNL